MTVTIFTTLAGSTATVKHAPYPAYSDTHMSSAVWGMLEHHIDELAAGRLAVVSVVSDGKSREQSARDMDEEARGADASEAHMRAMGG